MNDNELIALLAGLGIFIFVFLAIVGIFVLLILAIIIIANWKLFEKAGEPGWKAIIPIYNTLIMSKIATGNYKIAIASLCCQVGYSITLSIANALNALATSGDGSLGALALISLPFSLLAIGVALAMSAVNIYFRYLFTKSYGKDTLWCVLSIFFTPIVSLIMAFDKNTNYVGPQKPIKWFE